MSSSIFPAHPEWKEFVHIFRITRINNYTAGAAWSGDVTSGGGALDCGRVAVGFLPASAVRWLSLSRRAPVNSSLCHTLAAAYRGERARAHHLKMHSASTLLCVCVGVNKAPSVHCRREKLLLVLEFNLAPTRKARHNSFNTRPLMCYQQQFVRLRVCARTV